MSESWKNGKTEVVTTYDLGPNLLKIMPFLFMIPKC